MDKDISNDNFSIFLMRLHFSWCGVKLENEPLRHLSPHWLLIAAFNSVVVVQQILALCYARDPNDIGVIFSNLTHVSNYIVTWVLLLRKQDTLGLILETVRRGIHRYPPPMQRFLVRHRRQNALLQVLFYAANASFFIILVAPMLDVVMESARTPNDSNLMYPAWYPWTINSRTSYFLTYLLQLIGALITAGYMPTNIIFLLYFVLVVRDQTMVLVSVTRNVVQEYKQSNSAHHRLRRRLWHEEAEHDARLRNAIIECVKHHHSIMRFIGYFVSSYKWIFILNLIYSTVIFTLNCYLLLSSDYYLPKFTQRICELVLVFPYLFVYCYIGEVFKDVNNVFRETIYEVNWYEKPVKLQKSILILLASTSKEITLSFSEKLVASYVLFGSILKSSYTYANILLNTTRK